MKDTRFPKSSEFWSFGKVYDSKNVYIKLRVEILKRIEFLFLSFHFSEWHFKEEDFHIYRVGDDFN